MEGVDSYVAGNKVLATELNQISKNANDGGSFRDDKNAGETINGATTPVPVYQDSSDSELYACDANVTTKIRFIGFATSNSTNGNPINFQGDGIVRGFTGLTPGVNYYVQDAVGTIGVNPGTIQVLVGFAISSTELLIIKGRKVATGTLSFSATAGATNDQTATIGFRAQQIRVYFSVDLDKDGNVTPYRGIADFIRTTFVGAFGTQETDSGTSVTFQTIDSAVPLNTTSLSSSGSGAGVNKSSGTLTVNSITESTFVMRLTNVIETGAGRTITATVSYIAIE